jgi:hypothetical protein
LGFGSDGCYSANMQSCETQSNDGPTKIPVDQLISPKQIMTAFEVGGRTVRRWAKSYGWKEYRFSHKVLRYPRDEVEESLGVSFATEVES